MPSKLQLVLFQLFFNALILVQLVHGVSVELDPKYHVTWHVSEKRDEVTFTVTAQTTGWVGLGFSSNGAMTKSDIFIGGVQNGEPFFNDYHGPEEGNGAPIVDKKNDYTLISASENGTHTTISFKRSTETCDPEDMPITDAGLRLIWAYGITDVIGYHGQANRNVKSVYILDPDLPVPDLSHLQEHLVVSKIKMPKVKTTYWCSLHRLPEFPEERQMIAYEPVFISANSRNFTHHMNILKCFDIGNGSHYDPWVGHEGVDCNTEETENFPGSTCVFLEYGWALGGELAVNPKDVGFPFKSRQYYKLEVHLNNPDNVEGEEVEVGFKIYHTDEIQKITGSLLMVSAPTNYQLMIPPNTTDFTAVAHCMPQCLNKNVIPETGVTAYNAFLHAHTSARKMRIRHYRGGKELPWIINDENYDFNYQTNRRLPNEVTILPGDQITAECIYDTFWKNGSSVIGGQSTDDEMCMVFIAYYPAIPAFVGCYDWMNKFNMFKILGIETVDKPTSKNPTVTAPEHLKGKRFSQVVEEFGWTDELRKEYQWQHQYGEHVTACLPRINAVTGYYPTGQKYEPNSICDVDNIDGTPTTESPASTTDESSAPTTDESPAPTTVSSAPTTDTSAPTTESSAPTLKGLFHVFILFALPASFIKLI